MLEQKEFALSDFMLPHSHCKTYEPWMPEVLVPNCNSVRLENVYCCCLFQYMPQVRPSHITECINDQICNKSCIWLVPTPPYLCLIKCKSFLWCNHKDGMRHEYSFYEHKTGNFKSQFWRQPHSGNWSGPKGESTLQPRFCVIPGAQNSWLYVEWRNLSTT